MARPLTLSTMTTEVYARLGETAGFYTDANIAQWLNDGMDDIALRLEPLLDDTTANLVDGTGEYAVPTGTISIHNVLVLDASSKWNNIPRTTFEALFRTNPSWESDAETRMPTYWYWRQSKIGFYPIPSTNVTNGIKYIYTFRPTEMTAAANTTGMEDYLDRVVVLYAVFRARLKNQDEKRAMIARSEWERAVDQAATILNKHSKEHAPKLVIDTAYSRRYNKGFQRFRAWSV